MMSRELKKGEYIDHIEMVGDDEYFVSMWIGGREYNGLVKSKDD